MAKEYRTIQEVAGPLMLVQGVENVTYNELGEIELANGEKRRCRVLEIDGSNALVQLFESATGINLSNSKIKEIFTPKNLLLCVISLVIVPFLTLGVDMLLPMSNTVMVIHVFLMAMPSAAIITVLCNRYNKNAKLAAEGVASTTFFSLGTLALWTLFLTKMFL